MFNTQKISQEKANKSDEEWAKGSTQKTLGNFPIGIHICQAEQMGYPSTRRELSAESHLRIGDRSIQTQGIRKKNHLKLSKREIYRKTQSLYKKNRADTVKWILDGNKKSICQIKPGLDQKAYKAIWVADEFNGLGSLAFSPKQKRPHSAARLLQRKC